MLRRAVIALLAAVLTAAGLPAAAQPNPDFWVVNTSGRQINEIYVSPATETSWGADWLREHVLPTHHRFAIRPVRDGTCIYDIRVVYDNNTAAEKRRVNTCEITEVIFP